VTGNASEDGSDVRHAWNKVLVDGEWRVVDATWDDVDSRRARRDYFLLAEGDAALGTRLADTSWIVDEHVADFPG
jgi:hypothetical protein